MKPLLRLFLLLSFLSGQIVFGQQQGKGTTQSGAAWSLHTGPLLPNQITGMDEILLTWGLRFGWPTSRGRIEIGALNGRGDGIEYYNISLSLRGDVRFEDLLGIFYIGADGHYYNSLVNPLFNFVAGGHFGVGVMAALGGSVWFRSDMKFNVNPGTSLYIGFGFVFGSPPEGGESGGGAGGGEEEEQ